MDKLKQLIPGLKSAEGINDFWEGAISDSKFGLVPVYLPNLLDHQSKVLDIPLANRIIQEALPELPDSVQKVVVYYVDIFDRPELENFIREANMTQIEVELRDLKATLDDIVLNDEVTYSIADTFGGYTLEIEAFVSDRLRTKIDEYNQKKGLKVAVTAHQPELSETDLKANLPAQKVRFKPIQISENGLELIEWLSLDCTNDRGPWTSDAEIKIDKKGFVTRNGKKTKEFWDGKITSSTKPLRLKLRNIAGDESVVLLT